MTTLHSIILGLVQGLGEFLPISSSGHLILTPWLVGWADHGLTFDIGLHFGTLIAVILYFWKDWLVLIHNGVTDIKCREGRLFWYLVAATIPGAIGGYLLEDAAETVFRNPILVATMLVVMGFFLWWADQKSRKQTTLADISFKTAFLIGVFQVLAIIPGTSRSGVTMTTGLFLGLTREAAARYSFLLSAPVIFGAAVIKIPYLIHNPATVTHQFLIGMFVACVTGIAAIGFLLKYVQTRTFLPFVWYRFALGILVFVLFFLRA
ncbi:MAG: undecaprenyl-diphosphate phosphatase [Deltaproteobacteria bacterium]|nr:undecaprenyl-diphosphate phosphatase [Deltaproteobacteria bacterium]